MRVTPEMRTNMSAEAAVMQSFRPEARTLDTDTDHLATSHARSSSDQIEKSTDALQKKLEQADSDVQLEYDKDLNKVIVKYVSPMSGEIVRQIPSEKVVQFEREYMKMVGLLFDHKL